MKEEYLIVVGDRFAEFARRNANVVVKSELDAVLEARRSRPLALIPGQGVNQSSFRALVAMAARFTRVRWICPSSCAVEPAGEDLCHKVFEANRLVSTPVRVDSERYRMRLVIDDDNELLQDHLTGEHIPGMVLIEAARQSFLAVAEKFHAEPGRRYRFVTTQLQTRYRRFLFPMDVHIEYRVAMLDINRHGRIECTATVGFYQGAEPSPATECEVRFKAYHGDFVEKRERDLACRSVTEQIDRARHDDAVIRTVFSV